MGGPVAEVKKRKFFKFLKKCFNSGHLKLQVKAVNEMKTLLDTCQPEYVADFLTDGDLIQPMAEAMSSCNPKLLPSICSYFLIVAQSKKFFKPSHASYLVQNCLRIYNLSQGKLRLAETDRIIELTLLTLRRLTEQNVRVSHICSNSQNTLLHLCKATLKSDESGPATLMNCCFVTVAVFSDEPSTDLFKNDEMTKVMLLTLKKIKSTIASRTASDKRSWYYLFSHLGFLLLRNTKLFSNSHDNSEQFLASLYMVIVDSLLPFLQVISRDSKKDAKVTLAALTLINEWLLLNKVVKDTKPMYTRIAASGLFYSLTALRLKYCEDDKIQLVVNSVIVEVMLSACQNELCIIPDKPGRENHQSLLASGLTTLPKKISTWSGVLSQFPRTAATELYAVLLFFCVHYYFTSSRTIVTQIFSGICSCVRAISMDFSKPLFKILWFNFAVMYMDCKEKLKIEKLPEAVTALVSYIEKNKEDFEQIIPHHTAMLLWAFACDVPLSLKEKVLDSWLQNLNPKSLTTLKNLCLISQQSVVCILNVLCSTKSSTAAKYAAKIFYSLLQKKPEHQVILWKKAYLLFSVESAAEMNVYYFITLLSRVPLLKMDSLLKLRFFSYLLSFWAKWEETESSGKKYHQIVGRIVLLTQKLLSDGATIPLVNVTDSKFLNRIEVNLQSSNHCVRYNSTCLLMSVLNSLPQDYQMDHKVFIRPACILENICGDSIELSAQSVHLITAVFKPENANLLALENGVSFEFLRALLVYLLQLIMKCSDDTVPAIYKCFDLILTQSKNLNFRILTAHFVTHPAFSSAVLWSLELVDDLNKLFSESFLDFLSSWFTDIYDDKLIRHLLISQRRNFSHFVSNIYRCIFETSEKLLEFLNQLDLSLNATARVRSLESLIDVFISLNYILPPPCINSFKGKKDNLRKQRIL